MIMFFWTGRVTCLKQISYGFLSPCLVCQSHMSVLLLRLRLVIIAQGPIVSAVFIQQLYLRVLDFVTDIQIVLQNFPTVFK